MIRVDACLKIHLKKEIDCSWNFPLERDFGKFTLFVFVHKRGKENLRINTISDSMIN